MTNLEIGGNTTEASEGDWMEEQSSEGLMKDVQPEECSVEVPGEDQTQELNTEGDGVSEDVAGVTTELLIDTNGCYLLYVNGILIINVTDVPYCAVRHALLLNNLCLINSVNFPNYIMRSCPTDSSLLHTLI